jgi:hypothetical protein
MLVSNLERRRLVKHTPTRTQRCEACGNRGFLHSHDLPFCTECLDWARQKNLVEWDDLGSGE